MALIGCCRKQMGAVSIQDLYLSRLGRLNGSIRSCCSEAVQQSGEHVADQARGGLPRFYLDNLPKSKGMVAKLDGDEFWHMTKVLRLGLDDRVELFDGRGGITTGCISRIGRTSVELIATEDPCTLLPGGPNWHVAAAFATLKGGRADWLVEKCTELGARTLTALVTERSSSVLDRRNTRWQRVVLAAAKQCQRLHALELQESMNIQALATEVAKSEIALLATAGATPLVGVLSSSQNELQSGILIVGPEGDFTEDEKEMLITAGAIPVGLGPRRLRVETATVAMLATIMMMCDAPQRSSSLYELPKLAAQ